MPVRRAQSSPPQRGRPSRFSKLAAAAALLCGLSLATAGCDLDRQRAAESESILALIPADPSPAVAASWMFDQYDSDKRFRGTLLLARAPFGGEDVYVRGYLEHLNDPDSSVRAAAAFALAQHGSPEHVPRIIPLLRQEERLVRLHAARALQRLHNPVAVQPLLERLDTAKETEADVRAEAATALGQYAEVRVLQGLIAALADDRLAVTFAATNSLRTLTGQDFGDNRREWVQFVSQASNPFEGRTAFTYPVFNRDRRWIEFLPFWPPPPNETAAQPAGMPDVGGTPPPSGPRAAAERSP